jgi:hypothetical protein
MASPVFHWKMACTAIWDEALHQSAVKVDVGTPNFCRIQDCQEKHQKTKKIAACWLFAFVAHTLAAPDSMFALIGPCVIFTLLFSV